MRLSPHSLDNTKSEGMCLLCRRSEYSSSSQITGISRSYSSGTTLGIGESGYSSQTLRSDDPPRNVIELIPSVANGPSILPSRSPNLAEIFEALTLIQTKKIHDFPVVLYGTDYWKGLLKWLEDQPLKERMISRKDLKLFKVTDDKEEIVEIIQRQYVRRQRSPRQHRGGHETP
jgi:hypothetical protein